MPIQESGLYYLQSRYYNPEWGRFLNSDVYTSTGQGIIGNNMFAYCYNNPINALDPEGEDAIWLQELYNHAVKGAGHTGLLIEDENGIWHYFNWNDKGGTLTTIGTGGDTGLHNLPDFITEKYDRVIYFKGDFSASVAYATNLPGKHSMLWNNCMQVSVDVLMRGEFAKSDFYYKAFLYRVRNTIVPNIAYSRMVNFHNAVQTYHAAPKWAKWLYTSPERAVRIY